jgi:lambda repressor-like predicted transcriptional regulator
VAPLVPLAGLAHRIEAGRIAKGWTKAEVCARAGLKQQRYATVMKRGGPKYLQRIAEALGVRVEWLTTGAFPPEWYRPDHNMPTAAEQAQLERETSSQDDSENYDDNGQASPHARGGKSERSRTGGSLPLHIAAHIPIIGVVTAGAGWAEPSQDPDDHQPIPIPSHWRAVTIQGDSGYPVVWNGQTVLVDDRLPLKHNRLVVVQTEDRRAYLKRYCVCHDVAAGFILASVNIGRDSFALHPNQAVRMSVVVGTLFTDSVVKS